MNQEYKTFVVINPKSADGSTGKNLNSLLSKLKSIGQFTHYLTESQSHATVLTNNALKKGYNRIIAIGGDGTFNEVSNGFFENNHLINDKAVLGFISGGTGADFIRTLEIPANINRAIDKIVLNKIKKIDIAKIISLDEYGQKIERYFLNASNIGLGGDVVKKVNSSTKLLGGFATFLVSTIETAMKYENQKVKIILDNETILEDVFSNIIVANGRFCGGGMKFLPSAEVNDGLLDILTIGDINKLEFFENIFKVYRGTHLEFEKITTKKAKKIEIITEKRLRVETDGENCGFTPAKYEIIPNILNIIA